MSKLADARGTAERRSAHRGAERGRFDAIMLMCRPLWEIAPDPDELT
jgi:hypothetical protein